MAKPTKPPLNPTLKAFGDRVRARRLELGWSQEAAADEIGVHWTHLGQVERGQRSARVENILKFAAGLQTTPGALLDGLPAPAD
ncbi:helix-turn-helix domain-containing protein [Nocardia sp. NPDC057663]|uniref:helix-turn-helix domain-containing protein n=1 Tax=Nocardia sp. NPDC057663 TaxID=3346201 RepID=UPI00366A65F2